MNGAPASAPATALTLLAALLLAVVPAVGGDPEPDPEVVVTEGHVWVLKDGEIAAGDASPAVIADRLRVVTGEGTRPRLIAALGGRSGGFLGISMTDVDAREGGVRVLDVIDGSPAERAGLAEGDVIVEIGGKPVGDTAALSSVLESLSPGDRVQVSALRDGTRTNFDVELGERPHAFALALGDDALSARILDLSEGMARLGEVLEVLPDGGALSGKCEEDDDCLQIEVLPRLRSHLRELRWHARPKLGVQLTEATPELREHLGGKRDAGVLVARIMPDTPAERADLRVGDLIMAVDGRTIRSASDLIRALRDADGRTIEIELVRDRRARSIDVAIPEPDEDDAPGRPAV